MTLSLFGGEAVSIVFARVSKSTVENRGSPLRNYGEVVENHHRIVFDYI